MSIKFNLIIDSCCDLPWEMVQREGVFLLEFPYSNSKGEHFDDFYKSITPHEFYEPLRKGECSFTAQISPAVYLKAYEEATDHNMPAVYLSFSSGLSGAVETASLLRDQFIESHPDRELYVVDTKLGSIAEGLLVYEALHQREKGLSASELVDWVGEAIYYIDGRFMLDDFDSLRRGGRIPQTVATMGAKLDVKPLLAFTLDGRLSFCGVARGRKKGLRAIAEYFESNATNGEVENFVIIAHADVPKEAERLKDMLAKVDERAIIIESNIGPVIGSHVGPGMITAAFWAKDRREEISVADRIARKVKGK